MALLLALVVTMTPFVTELDVAYAQHAIQRRKFGFWRAYHWSYDSDG